MMSKPLAGPATWDGGWSPLAWAPGTTIKVGPRGQWQIALPGLGATHMVHSTLGGQVARVVRLP